MGGTTRNAARSFGADADDGWVRNHGDVYRFVVHVGASKAGFTATAATVPGATGSGETEAAALAVVREVLTRDLKAAKAAGAKLRRSDPRPAEAGVVEKVVVVRLGDAV